MSDFTLSPTQTKYYQAGLVVLRIGLGLLFIYASLDKIWHPGLFAQAISNYRILPLSLLHLVAIILPWLEFVSGMALFSNHYVRAANIIIGTLTLVFTIAILSAMYRGLDFNCGCFNLASEELNLGLAKVLQNIGLLGASVTLEFSHRRLIPDR